MESLKVIIAGGGTGGHLFPAIAIAEEFLTRDKNTKVLFIGTKQGIEYRVIPQRGFELKTISAGGVKGKGYYEVIKTVAKIPVSIFQSAAIIYSYKTDLVIGVGGYASLPPVIAAFLLRTPNIIHEQNMISGLTNKILARLTDKIAVSFKESLKDFPIPKAVFTGNPVRRGLLDRIALKTDRGGRFTIFVFGGSQGAGSINKAIVELLPMLEDIKDKIHIIHQTGSKDIDMVKEAYERYAFSHEASSFIEDMASCYGKADMVIARSGATTIAEISACRKPAILIPYPYSANNHQEKNAKAVHDGGGGVMILDKELNGNILSEKIRAFMGDRILLQRMADNISGFANINAAEKIVDVCMELIKAQRHKGTKFKSITSSIFFLCASVPLCLCAFVP